MDKGYLEQKIENLKAKHDDLDLPAGERYQAVIDLEVAERALACFRQTYELEKKVQQISN